ncbi:hypothetical protein AB0910_15970 [Streptomyces sp. NPDC047002]|uniref:hypothetical protein n=1 Tax=Streptomyces sp. NPDC047002 TaxID=3155475 RepID=UPI0034533D27
MTWGEQSPSSAPDSPAPWGRQPDPKEPRDYGRRPGWTRKRFVIPGAALLFFIGVAIGTSGNGDSTTTAADAKPAPTVTATATVTDRPAARAAAAVPTVTVTATATRTMRSKAAEADTASDSTAVPSFVGMGLQAAQDKAQAAGFFLLRSHDSTGAGRFQILDRDWKVCSQNVEPGKHASTETELDFGAVKLSETCP